MNVKNRKAGRSEATRSQLLRIARLLFATKGFASVATEEIVRRSGVTRGALYHHFKDKKDLFRSVFEDLEKELTERIASAVQGESDPWRQQKRGWETYLDICSEPAVQRIAVDAPSVLGWQAWREISDTYGGALVRAGIQNLIDAGLIKAQPVEPLARMLLGALHEAGLVIAGAKDVKATRAEIGASIERLLSGLRIDRR